MDQDAFITTHRAALMRIVTALIAMAGRGEVRLPRQLSRAVWRVLRPAEAAVRRLIVIAAQSLPADLPPSRPFPKGLVIARPGRVRFTFQLFDPRPEFSSPRRTIAAIGIPRVHGFGASPLSPLFHPRPVASPPSRTRGREQRAPSRPPSRGAQNGARNAAAPSETPQALAGPARPD